LETRGVPVVGYGTNDFPAFWSRSSGLRLNLRFDDPEETGRFLNTQWQLGDTGGVLIANPIPEQDEIPPAEMASYIEAAIAQAAQERIAGKAVTPWLLDRIFHLTQGRSLQANVALVKHNARLAARIARFVGN
jgi:pseudouridine-5'-phosphate glycosidase